MSGFNKQKSTQKTTEGNFRTDSSKSTNSHGKRLSRIELGKWKYWTLRNPSTAPQFNHDDDGGFRIRLIVTLAGLRSEIWMTRASDEGRGRSNWTLALSLSHARTRIHPYQGHQCHSAGRGGSGHATFRDSIASPISWSQEEALALQLFTCLPTCLHRDSVLSHSLM